MDYGRDRKTYRPIFRYSWPCPMPFDSKMPFDSN